MIADGEITADEAKMGYVGAFAYAEVISGYTAFYLGAKSVCPTVKMEVQFTGAWYDENLERNAATALINNGCVLISQSSDSFGAVYACDTYGVINIANNISEEAFGNTTLLSLNVNYAPYFEYVIECYMEDTPIYTDWCRGFEEHTLETIINYNLATENIDNILYSITEDLIYGYINVFDINSFTVNGQMIYSYYADVDTDDSYIPDTEVIAGGAFLESWFRSAPYFNIRIDGITLLNECY